MSKENLIPELRFTEFGNEGKWEVESLGEIAEIVTGSTPSTSEPLYYNGTKLFVSPADINVNRYVSQTKTTLSDIGFSKTRKIKANSVLFVCIGSTIGKVAQNKFECATNQQLNSLIPYDGNSSDFLYSILDFNSTNIASIAGNHAVPLINKTSFSAIKLNFPPTFKEQQKIASCLSSLDEVIAAHTQKLVLLKDHKKGLMQNLFPQEGETIPKYRFKEFENDGDWEVKSLGEIAEIVTGSTPSTSEPLYYNGTKLFVSPADINVNRYVSQTKTTLSDIGFSKTRKIKANSVLFVCIGSTIGKVAQNKFECATNQQLNSLIPYDGNSSDFLYSILDFNSTNIASIAGNHAVPLINKTSFSAIKLNFPPTFKEQQKIASCLSSLDAIITEQTEKIEQLKLHKKGLMQGLFPKINN